MDVKDYENAEVSTSTLLHLEENGGHMGYLSGLQDRWLDQALEIYLRSLTRA